MRAKYAEAKERFERGVAAGDAACMDYLGYLYLEGFGTTARSWIAYGLFREAAGAGERPKRAATWAICISAGAARAVVADAAKWWRSARNAVPPRAARSLADLLTPTMGSPKIRRRRSRCGRKAAARGNAGAEAALLSTTNRSPGKATPATTSCGSMRSPNREQRVDSVARFLKLRQSGKLDHYVELPYEPQAHNFCAVASSSLLARFGGLDTTQFDLARAASPPDLGQRSRLGHDTSRSPAQKGQSWKVESFPTPTAATMKASARLTEMPPGAWSSSISCPTKYCSAHTIVLVGHSAEAGEFVFRDQAWNFPGIQ
ncbi:MAG: hypothetical protein R3F11_19345 [Verrucomicrobiales bacterium]